MSGLRPERRASARRIFGAGLIVLWAVGGLCSCAGPEAPPEPEMVIEAESLSAEGSLWFSRGCHDQAMAYFNRALIVYRLMDDLPGIQRCLNNLGASALVLDRLGLAAEYLQQALETEGDPTEKHKILGNLGGLAFKSGRNEDALEFWERAAALADQDPEGPGPALHLNNLGMLHRISGRPREAELALNESLERLEGLDRWGLEAGAHLQLGLLAQEQGDYELAEIHLTRALILDKQKLDSRSVASDLEKLGRLSQARADWAEAAGFLDRSVRMYQALGDKEKVEMVFGLLLENHRAGGVPESMDEYRRLLSEEPPESMLCPSSRAY